MYRRSYLLWSPVIVEFEYRKKGMESRNYLISGQEGSFSFSGGFSFWLSFHPSS